jgi:RNA methyltransferase, TrmH family
MAVRLGAHAQRLSVVRGLQTTKGRRESGRFAFEGATLLEEALLAGLPIDELYVTEDAYDAHAAIRDADASGVTTFIVERKSAAKISDLESPPGILAVARASLTPLGDLFVAEGVVLVLADLNDPGNVGTLMRSAEAFGGTRIAVGRRGADPFHPKVVRAAMGAAFRLRIALADPDELAATAAANRYAVFGLSAAGASLAGIAWPQRCALVVGQERSGLGRWAAACNQTFAIPMAGSAESLNAGVAGSIALYEAAKGTAPVDA